MAELALDFSVAVSPYEREVQVIHGNEREHFVFLRGRLLASYAHSDLYTRNFLIVQLFINHRVRQGVLSEVFGLSVAHISRMVKRYRVKGSAGIVDSLDVRIKNNRKISAAAADYLTNLLSQTDRPTYEQVADRVNKRFGIGVSAGRIGNWWRAERSAHAGRDANQTGAIQISLVHEQTAVAPLPEEVNEDKAPAVSPPGQGNKQGPGDASQWQNNAVAGSFILYALLYKSQFLRPFVKGICGALYQGKQSVERVMLSLFFMHALRLKSIEQSKHLSAEHFGALVLGRFYRQQSLRKAIDVITGHQQFDEVVSLHYRNLSHQTQLGDEIYYVDGHFSCYYGKHTIPKGYDSRRKQPARGRNTVYLHNSLGHHVLSFESPTNTTLSVDIETLIEKMNETHGRVEGKTLFFDRGGFSAKCFKRIKREGMYFATYLKHRKKESEIDLDRFSEEAIEIDGETIKDRIHEKARQTKAYGVVRTIVFIGRQGKQIPIITTNPELSAAEIVARLQKRWVEENGFKYMREHFNIDLLTTYKTEQAPDKIMTRRNPKRKEINRMISSKKQELKALRDRYSNRIDQVKNKEAMTIATFEQQEEKLKFAIKNKEMELGLLEHKRQEVAVKVQSNLKDECVISRRKRRLFINLIKCMNYNCEKWLQDLFCQIHPKKDETLSLIRQVLKTPGRIRQQGDVVEVELNRLDSNVQATSLDNVLDRLSQYNYLKLPDGRGLNIKQAA